MQPLEVIKNEVLKTLPEVKMSPEVSKYQAFGMESGAVADVVNISVPKVEPNNAIEFQEVESYHKEEINSGWPKLITLELLKYTPEMVKDNAQHEAGGDTL